MCCGDVVYWWLTGYTARFRLVEEDKCDPDTGLDLLPQMVECTKSSKSKGGVSAVMIVLILLAVAVVVLLLLGVGGGVYLYMTNESYDAAHLPVADRSSVGGITKESTAEGDALH